MTRRFSSALCSWYSPFTSSTPRAFARASPSSSSSPVAQASASALWRAKLAHAELREPSVEIPCAGGRIRKQRRQQHGQVQPLGIERDAQFGPNGAPKHRGVEQRVETHEHRPPREPQELAERVRGALPFELALAPDAVHEDVLVRARHSRPDAPPRTTARAATHPTRRGRPRWTAGRPRPDRVRWSRCRPRRTAPMPTACVDPAPAAPARPSRHRRGDRACADAGSASGRTSSPAGPHSR